MNYKKVFSMLMCILMAVSASSPISSNIKAYAEGESSDTSSAESSNDNTYITGNYRMHYSINTDGEEKYASIDSYDLTSYVFPDIYPLTLTTPPEIDGYPVGAIGNYAFGIDEYCDCLPCPAQKLVITSNYTDFKIGESAFRNCNPLRIVELPENLSYIGKEAFFGCDNLNEITIPKNVTTIEDKALGYVLGRVYVKQEDGSVIDIESMLPMPDFTIYGYRGTEAERYAKDNEFTFESIDPSGDINGDNELTMKDILILQKYIAGKSRLSSGELARADICNDGRINCFDIAEIKAAIIEKRKSIDYLISIDQHFSNINERFDSNAIIRSKNEMIDFLEDYISRKDIAEIYSAKYTDKFFEENVLLLGAVLQNYGSQVMYDVSITGFENNTLNVHCGAVYPPMSSECVISRLIAQIVIPKDQFTFDKVEWK